jgi:uncharacterized protein
MNKPLSEDEYDELESCLSRFQNKQAMNLEMVDGFFTALHCSPQMTPPSVYLQQIWGGGEMADDEIFDTNDELQSFINLLLRHWNAVSRKLSEDEVFLPLLLEDSDGNEKGNDWANGFIRGMRLHKSDWSDLADNEENGGSLVPILALAYENDPDPAMRSYKEPVDAERRELLLASLSVGAMHIYKYFESHRRTLASDLRNANTFRRETPKVGRNEPCSCGSGRKFKRCCGDVTLN